MTSIKGGQSTLQYIAYNYYDKRHITLSHKIIKYLDIIRIKVNFLKES